MNLFLFENCFTGCNEPPKNHDQHSKVITIGKTNFVVKEHFADHGKELDELIERLVVKKCRKIS